MKQYIPIYTDRMGSGHETFAEAKAFVDYNVQMKHKGQVKGILRIDVDPVTLNVEYKFFVPKLHQVMTLREED